MNGSDAGSAKRISGLGLFLTVFVVTSGLTALATFLWWQFRPSYTAFALLAITPQANNLLGNGPNSDYMYTKELIERDKRSQASLVKTQAVLQDAIKMPELRKTEWYRKHEAEIYEELEKKIDVQPLPETRFIRLSMTGANKDELPGIVNSVADAFVDFARKPARQEKQGEIDRLNNQRDAMVKRRADLQREMSVLRAGSALAAMRNQQTTVSVKLQELTRDIAKAQADYAQAAGDADSFDGEVRSNALARNAMVLQAVEADAVYRELLLQKVRYEIELDALLVARGEPATSAPAKPAQAATMPSPEAKLRILIGRVDERLQDRRKEIIKAESDKISQMRQSEKTRAQKALADLSDRLKGAREEARDLETSIGKLEALEKEGLELEKPIAVLDAAILERSLTIKNGPNGESTFGPVSIQARATVPSERSAPRFQVMIPAGMGLGVAVGLVVLLCRKLFGRRYTASGGATRLE